MGAPNLIDLEGLPEPVSNAIALTVETLKHRYRPTASLPQKPAGELPSCPGRAVGSLRRIDLYTDR